MAISFDPSLPVDGALISAGELRNQLTSLDGEISAANSNAETRAFKPDSVDLLSTGISSPPTKAQVEELRDKLNELLVALKA